MKYILLFISLLLPIAVAAETISVSVYPPDLELTVPLYRNTTTHLTVQNPSPQVSGFEVYPQDFTSFISTMPQSFTLESKTQKEIDININPRKAGVYRTYILVSAQPLFEAVVPMGPGIKIPLTITVKDGSPSLLASVLSTVWYNPFLPYAVGIVALILILILPIWKTRPQKEVS